jgi:hypothetical protein
MKIDITPPAPAERETLTDEQILAAATKEFPRWREDIQERFVLRVVRTALAASTPIASRAAQSTAPPPTSDRASLIAKVEARLSGAPPVDLWGAGYDTAIREVLDILRSPA